VCSIARLEIGEGAVAMKSHNSIESLKETIFLFCSLLYEFENAFHSLLVEMLCESFIEGIIDEDYVVPKEEDALIDNHITLIERD